MTVDANILIRQMTIDPQDAAAARFPQYWQLMGSMVFKQLFSNLTEKVKESVEAREVRESLNQSLQIALHRTTQKIELQEAQLSDNANNIAVLQGLMKNETGTLGGGTTRAEPPQNKVEPAIQPAEVKEAQFKKELQSFKVQLEASEATRQTLSALVGRLQSRLLDLDPSLKTVGSEEVDLNASIDWKQVPLTVSHSQDYDYSLPGNLQVSLGVTSSSGPSHFWLSRPGGWLMSHCLIMLGYDLSLKPSQFSNGTTGIKIAPNDTRFPDLTKVDIYFYIQGLTCKPEIPNGLVVQPTFSERDENTFMFDPKADMKWVTALQLKYLIFDQANKERVHVANINHSDEEPASPRTITFDLNKFTRPPKVFLALHGFTATTDSVKRFKISVSKVEKDSMEVIMERMGYSVVRYLCVAVQYDE
ncbi:hypothetical protein N7451_003698 [Penicillium sp. IBT 35674x]|nr:hypothetical protein N7451_003698 [Penicillium sp. IBT 35674x]